MWVCLNDAFFSIVESDKDGSLLSVRARRKGDLERYFPGQPVHERHGADYAFRAFVPRGGVARILSETALGIPYKNFKNSVRDHRLHDAYTQVWSVMGELDARGRPYG